MRRKALPDKANSGRLVPGMARAAPNRPRQFQRRSPEAQAPGRRPEGVFGRAAFGVRSCHGRAGVAERVERRPAFGLLAARRPGSGR